MATGHLHINLREVNERVTGPPARRLIEAAHTHYGVFPTIALLDNACGGGILTREFMALHTAHASTTGRQITRLVAADLDERMLDYVKQLSEASNWQPQVETLRSDQAAAPLDEGSFTHVMSNFGVFFSPNDGKVLAETRRLLRGSGVAGFTSWKYLGWWDDVAVPVLRDAFPDAPALPHPSTIMPSQGWNDPVLVRAKLEGAGFVDVEVEEMAFTPETEAEGFSAACAMLVKGIAARLWPKEVNEKYSERIQPEMEKMLREKWERGVWGGKMVAVIATGRKG